MIRKIVSSTAEGILANIKNNPPAPIRANVLRDFLLALNRDAYGGELEYTSTQGQGLTVEDISSSLTGVRLAPGLMQFLSEWFGGGAYPFGDNCYVSVYSGSVVVAYMLVRKASYRHEGAVGCFLVGNTEPEALGVDSFKVWIRSADFEDSPVVAVRYASGVLDMNLPMADTDYDGLQEMLDALGISYFQFEGLKAGAFHSVRVTGLNSIYQIERIVTDPDNADALFLAVGYMTPWYTQMWNIDFAALEVLPKYED